MDKPDLVVIIRQVGIAVADFCERRIEQIPGWMRKYMTGDQFAACYKPRTEEVKETITLWPGQTGTPKE